MNVAKKNGANGGTLLKGREFGNKGFKFFNVQVEPEKDILLIVCKENDKNNGDATYCMNLGNNKKNKRNNDFNRSIDNTEVNDKMNIYRKRRRRN